MTLPRVKARVKRINLKGFRSMRASSRVHALTAMVAVVALGCPAPSPPDADSVAVAAEPWYRQATALDLTGDGQADSVRLEAYGTRPDSLQIVLRLLVDGQEKHREEWGSSYELALVDSVVRTQSQLDEVLRIRLDTVLARVKVERLDAPGVRVMAEDTALLTSLVPRPTYRVSIAYGYETTVRLVWDAPRQRFVRLWSCC